MAQAVAHLHRNLTEGRCAARQRRSPSPPPRPLARKPSGAIHIFVADLSPPGAAQARSPSWAEGWRSATIPTDSPADRGSQSETDDRHSIATFDRLCLVLPAMRKRAEERRRTCDHHATFVLHRAAPPRSVGILCPGLIGIRRECRPQARSTLTPSSRGLVRSSSDPTTVSPSHPRGNAGSRSASRGRSQPAPERVGNRHRGLIIVAHGHEYRRLHVRRRHSLRGGVEMAGLRSKWSIAAGRHVRRRQSRWAAPSLGSRSAAAFRYHRDLINSSLTPAGIASRAGTRRGVSSGSSRAAACRVV